MHPTPPRLGDIANRPNSFKLTKLSWLAGLTFAVTNLCLSHAQADEQNFPLQSYRVGPYAAGGTGFFGGFIDYMNLINIRDGGVNGVKLTWEQGETQYEVERGVEVHERFKTLPGIAAWNPLSVGIAYAMRTSHFDRR
jgi:branched-chain amino acid transport system substrate-binding protein